MSFEDWIGFEPNPDVRRVFVFEGCSIDGIWWEIFHRNSEVFIVLGFGI